MGTAKSQCYSELTEGMDQITFLLEAHLLPDSGALSAKEKQAAVRSYLWGLRRPGSVSTLSSSTLL